MHDPYGIEILADHAFHISSAFLDIAQKSADKTDISRCVDKDLDVELVADLLVFKNEEAFQNENVRRLYLFDDVASGVDRVVVGRLEDRLSLAELIDLLLVTRSPSAMAR